MSVQQTGLAYIFTYSGAINVLEQIVNVAIVTFLALAGYTTNVDDKSTVPSIKNNTTKGLLLNVLAITAFICTAIWIVLKTYGVTKRTRLHWHWIECIYALVAGILFVALSSVVMSVFTKFYVITGIIGYGQGAIYFLDMFDKYQWAIAPTPKYAWTTPNMPDLS